jgi:hypothetical protein
MSERAAALADEIEQATAACIAFAERCSSARWEAPATDEGRTIGTVIHHIAASYPFECEALRAMVAAQPLPAAYQDSTIVHAINAQHAEDYRHCTQQEAIALLRHEGALAVRLVRGLSDAQLDRQVYWPYAAAALSVEDIARRMLVSHPRGHLDSAWNGPGGQDRARP